MKKMRLDADDIQVAGFQVTPTEAERRGTVMGREEMETGYFCPTNGEDYTCRYGSCYSGNPCSYCP